MGKASFAQVSFLGGEWSKQMQGRFDREDYRSGMNLCLNIIPIEEGAAPRRSGTRLGGTTRDGKYAVLREYNVAEAQPYDIELTDSHLRIWVSGAGLVTIGSDLISGITSASPAVFTSMAHGLVSGDEVIFTLDGSLSYAGISQVLGRQMLVDAIDADTFRVTDPITAATVDGTLITFSDLTNLAAHKILDLDTPYVEADLQQVRIVQDGANALLLHNSHPPQTFTLDFSDDTDPATFAPTTFYDGPYLDIPADATTLTPSALTGSITFTASAITSVNAGQGFLSTDVGRMFRVFSEPPLWAVGTAYIIGDKVKEADVYWKAVKASTGVQPSTDNGTTWVIATTAAIWTWGTITSIVSATAFIGVLHAAVAYPDNTAGGDLLYTSAITAWQLGAFSDTTGYPSTGAYYQGRIWLGGAIKNRFDASVSNDFGVNDRINFAPTGKDGTVADNNGISGTLNSKEIENFLWMLPDEQGVLAGTQSGEWAIASSSAGEPITPTSIQTRETTHYGSLNMPAVKVGRATIFISRDTRKIYEYMANYFTQKFVADNLILKSKHMTVGGAAEIAYMRELTPVIWVRLANGGLIGCTYKHDDPIKPIEFAAWHRHELGTGRAVISIQGGPANGGQTDTLAMVTQEQPPDWDDATAYTAGLKVKNADAYWTAVQDSTGAEPSADDGTNWIVSIAICYVEFLQTIWDDGDSLLTAWYVDGGAIPAGADRLMVGSYNGVNLLFWSAAVTYAADALVVGSDNIVYQSVAGANSNHNPVGDAGVHWTSKSTLVVPVVVIRIYGLWNMIGQIISVWGAGLDLGDFTVSADGTIDLPLNAASSLFTDGLLAAITDAGCTPLSVEVV